MTAHAMNHFTILAEDLAQTCAFYRDLLGLTDVNRPEKGFPRASHFSVSKVVLPLGTRTPLPQPRAGVIDHMAFSAVGLADTVKKLEQKGLKYSLGRQVETSVWQLFFHDPNGARVELDFAAAENEPA
jgi:catechol 2,3-dioxygenase-like lactoylglutathione lyase family enzyme